MEEAKSAGVPTVIIDSALQSNAIVSFVATDNRKGGTLAADRMGQLLERQRQGARAALRGRFGEHTGARRRLSEADESRSIPDIELISTDQYAGRHARYR